MLEIGIALSHCSGIWPHLGLRGDLVIFLELQGETRVSSQVKMGIWWNLSSFKMGVKPPGGTLGCSIVTTGESDLISC